MKAIFDDIFSLFRTNPRQIALRTLANSRGWRFSKRGRFERQPIELQQFELFRGKKDKRVLSLMQMGSRRVEGVFSVYDYVYYGDLKNSVTTVCQFEYPSLKMSYFGIRPKGFLSTLKDWFVTSPRLFATTPDFDERYELHASDPESLKLELNEDFLDHVGDHPGWTFEGGANLLIAYKYGTLIDPSDMEFSLEYFEKVCERLINGKGTSDIE